MLIFIFILAVESLAALDFDAAQIRALQHPMLDSSEGMIGSRYYQYNQSGALANPEFSVTVEGFGKNGGGGGNWGNNNNNEVTYTLSQLIETAGKRTFRQNIAAYEWHKACLLDSLKRRSFLLKFSNDFFMTSFYEERIKIQEEKISLMKERIVSLEESVKLGKAREYDLRREKQLLRLAELELLNRKHEWQLSHKLVESGLCDELDHCGGAIYREPLEVECDIEENPILEIVSVEREILYLTYGLEKAKRIPNFILSGGYSSTFDNKQTSYLFEIDMPIPIFDQNQGGIAAASLEIERKDNEYQALLKALCTKKSALEFKADSIRESLALLQSTVLKEGDEQLQLLEKGGADKLTLAEFKLSLLESKELYIETLKNLHLALFELKYLSTERDL